MSNFRRVAFDIIVVVCACLEVVKTMYITDHVTERNIANGTSQAHVKCGNLYEIACLSNRNPCQNTTVCSVDTSNCSVVCTCVDTLLCDRSTTESIETTSLYQSLKNRKGDNTTQFMGLTTISTEGSVRNTRTSFLNLSIQEVSSTRIASTASSSNFRTQGPTKVTTIELMQNDLAKTTSGAVRNGAVKHRDVCKGIPKDVFNCGGNGRCYIARRAGFVLPKCKCRPGWRGRTCQTARQTTTVRTTMGLVRLPDIISQRIPNATEMTRRRDLCEGIYENSFNCMRRGTCQLVAIADGMAVPRCICDSGWIGRFCQQRCTAKCLNGGRCRVVYRGRAGCSCRKNYTGRWCERDNRRLGDAPKSAQYGRHVSKNAYSRLIDWILGMVK